MQMRASIVKNMRVDIGNLNNCKERASGLNGIRKIDLIQRDSPNNLNSLPPLSTLSN